MSISIDETKEIMSTMAFDIQREFDNVSKSDVVELKSYKAPPQAIVPVSEAVCLLFAKKPSFENFVKLVNSTDILNSMRSYDLDHVSEYALTELKKIIDKPEYKPENIKKVSKFATFLCKWTIYVYKYSMLKSSVSIDPVFRVEKQVENCLFFLWLMTEAFS